MKNKFRFFVFITILIFSPLDIFLNKNKTLVKASNNNSIDTYEIAQDYYIIGPGDVLRINFLYEKDFSGEYLVLSDGSVSLPLVGTIYLKDLTINSAQTKLISFFRNELINPELFITIEKQRPVRISILGEIKMPGFYSLTTNEASKLDGSVPINKGLPTLIDALQKAGGITQNSDLMNVKLQRKIPNKNNEYKETILNLLEIIQNGKQIQNPILFDGDIIKISKAKEIPDDILSIAEANFSPKNIRVTIIGEIENPGLRNLKTNTPLNLAVYQAGGPIKFKANKSNIRLIRASRNGTISSKRYKLNMNTKISPGRNPILKDNDIVIVGSSNLSKLNTTLKTIVEPLNPLVTAYTFLKLIE